VNTGTLVRDYTCITFSKNSEDYLFAGTSSGDLIGFLVKNKMLVFSINVCAMGVKTIKAVSQDRIIVGGGDGQVALFKTNGKDTSLTQRIQIFGAIHGLSVSPDGLQSLVATEKGYIYRVRNNDLSQMLLCENHTAPVLSCWFSPNASDKFITTSEDGTIRLWDSNNYTVTARCIASSSSIAQGASVFANCAIFTDEVILSGWSDGRIRAYRADNCQQLWQIDNAHKGGVTAICLSHNCKFICSGGMEGEVRVWEIRSRELVSHLKEHTSRVTKI
jgi:WD40 repeat protein